MKQRFFLVLASLSLLAGMQPALATGAKSFPFGAPGNETAVTKTIHVQANDQMRLIFDRQDIREGDVVKFIVSNSGQVPHEFGIADAAGQAAHQQQMMDMPGMMHHDHANVITLPPGETRTLIWSFKHLRQREIVFACNVPGHYQAGMFVRMRIEH